MNNSTINLIKKWESLHDGDLTTIGLQPKLDPIGIWTEGYGSAIVDPKINGFLKGSNNYKRALELSKIHTEQEAIEALNTNLGKYSNTAKISLGNDYWNKLNDNQKGALTSFVYNCGTGKPYQIFEKIRNFLDGKITKQDLIGYWQTSVTKAGGKVLQGLINRRADEALLFFKQD